MTGRGVGCPIRLNDLAWYAVSAPDATPALLRAAEAAAARAVARAGHPSFEDTRAQALHRLGRWDEAVPLELAALDHAEAEPAPAFYATQLARFLAARPTRPWTEGAEASPEVTWAAGAVTLRMPARTRAQRVGVLVREGAALKALVLACFAPGAEATQRVAVPGGAAAWRVEAALVRGVARCPAGAAQAHRMAPEALALP